MKWFRCLIHGQNFPGALIDRPGSVGFLTTRYVQADAPEGAEMLALAELKNDRSLELPESCKTSFEESKEAKVFFEQIAEVEQPGVSAGFTWYSVDENLQGNDVKIREVK